MMCILWQMVGSTCNEGACPAKGRKCFKCQRFNHFARCCRARAVRDVEKEKSETRDTASVTVPQEDSEPEASYLISVIEHNEPPWKVKLWVCGKELTFKIDTGADVNVISQKTYMSFKKRPPLQKTNAKLQSPGGKLTA